MDSFFITSEHPGFDEEIRTGFSFIQMTDVGFHGKDGMSRIQVVLIKSEVTE